MRFFSVRDRKMIDVPEEQVEAVKYERTTKSGKKQVRYALRVIHQGRKLIKFVDMATYKRYAEQEVPAPAGKASSKKLSAASHQRRRLARDRWGSARPHRSRLPRGTPGDEVAALAGSISDADAEEMLRAIEEGCEQINESQW